MLILYVRTGCPFCAKVLRVVDELHLQVVMRNISDRAVAEELIARGGKQQTPYLVDEEKNVEMYESDAIVQYLHQRFGSGE